jgi:hypothetical protein
VTSHRSTIDDKLSPDLVVANRQWLLTNWEPIDQLVDIDVMLEKSVPIDQMA